MSEREGYAQTLAADYENLSKIADTDEKRAALETEFARYRAGYRQHYVGMLASKSRCFSTMIAGPSNFPVRRQQKYSGWADNKLKALLEFRERALRAIRKVLCPEDRPIRSGDSDAASRLKVEIEIVERVQEIMRTVNGAIRRHAKDGPEKQIAACVTAGLTEAQAREILGPGARDVVLVQFEGRRCFASRAGFASSSMTNNAANIRRLKDRLVVVERGQMMAFRPPQQGSLEDSSRAAPDPCDDRAASPRKRGDRAA